MQCSDVLFRMQDFVSTIQNLGGFAPTIYDIIIVISKDLSAPNYVTSIQGFATSGMILKELFSLLFILKFNNREGSHILVLNFLR